MRSATFRGGPVNGHSFNGLKRMPTLVRVVSTNYGTDPGFDVLNDLDDRVRDGEAVVAVYLLDATSQVFVCARGRGAVGGEYVTYVHVPVVTAEVLGDEDRWLEYVAAVHAVPVSLVVARRAEERAAE